MSLHSYSKCWIHLVWGTLNGLKLLNKEDRVFLSDYLYKYSEEKGIYMKINYVNADHIHVLLDQPTSTSIEEIAKLFKGSSSYILNKERLGKPKLEWRRGYGVFSVSPSNLDKVCKYIAGQEAHHEKITYEDEFEKFLVGYGIQK